MFKLVGDSISKLKACLRWCGYYLGTLVFFGIIPTIQKQLFKKSFNDLKKSMTMFGKIGLKSLGVKGRIYNPHRINLEGNYILAANHRSWLDQVALTAFYPKLIHFLAKADYWNLPFFGRMLETIECIPITNRNLTKNARIRLDNSLKKNETVLFYIEGTRGSGKKLLPFRTGAFQTAVSYEREILPIYILGTEQILSKKRSMLDLVPGEIAIVIGKPVEFNEESFETQFAEFEKNYTLIHNKLYTDFDLYLSMKKHEQRDWVLPTLDLV